MAKVAAKPEDSFRKSRRFIKRFEVWQDSDRKRERIQSKVAANTYGVRWQAKCDTALARSKITPSTITIEPSDPKAPSPLRCAGALHNHHSEIEQLDWQQFC